MAFKTKEQSMAFEAERLSRQIPAAEAEQSKREDASKKRVVVTLSETPRERFVGSQKVVSFSGTEAGRSSPLSGVYFVPEHEARDGFARESFDQRLDGLNAGDKLSMSGHWAKRKWQDGQGKDRETWEFRAQNFAKGDASIEDMNLEARARIGDARLETLPVGEEVSSIQTARDSSRPPASPSLSYVSGDIVDDGAQVLVNTVNSQLSEYGNPVMGKGVALSFKERFPSIMKEYGDAIRSGELKPGRALLFELPDGRHWAALATKDHFRDNSQEQWVESGLKELGEKMKAAGLTSVALPPPGCGNGGLDWKRVEPLVHKHLEGLDVAMYAKPSGAMEPAAEISARRESPRRQPDLFAERPNAKAIAALGGEGSEAASKVWSEADIIKAIPSLFAAGEGYKPYAGIGSRETPQDVCDDMTAVAQKLETRGFTLRSGFAGGADTAFELGTSRDELREVFAPWKGFGQNPDSPHEKQRWEQIRRHERESGETFSPARPHLLQGEYGRKSEEMAAKHHPGWDKLGNGARQLHSRNMGQVYGPKLDTPARFEVAYTMDGKATGGTGQAIRVAESAGIPVLNMHNPRIRAAVLKELGIGPDRGISVDTQKEVASGVSRDSGSFDLSTPSIRSRRKDDVAYFCKVADPLGSLSNMHNRQPIEVDGVVWKSSEALFQALRFPHNPELQEAIRNESNAYTAKLLAHEHKSETRADWNEVNEQAMAWVVTLKKDQSALFRSDLESTTGRDIVELSVKDEFWGAKPKGDQLVGRDVLGNILTQLRDGARMDEPPAGSMLLGREIGSSKSSGQESLPEPSIKASMYFNFGAQKRDGVESASTFDAINAGERTSTTRFPAWGALDRWEKLEKGSVVRFYEDKDMRGQSVDVVVTGVNRIDLSKASPSVVKAWSEAEGWSEKAGRDFGAKYGEGVQIRYALPDSPEGREALAHGREGLPVSRSVSSEPAARGQGTASRPSPAQVAAMSDKQKWLSALG